MQSLAGQYEASRRQHAPRPAGARAALIRQIRLVLAAEALPGSRRSVADQLGVDPKTLRTYRADLAEFLAVNGFTPPWGRSECRHVADLIAHLKPPPRRARKAQLAAPTHPTKLRRLEDLRCCAQWARRRNAERHQRIRQARQSGMTLADAVSWPADRELTPADRMRLHRRFGGERPRSLRLIEMLVSPVPKEHATGYTYVGREPIQTMIELIANMQSEIGASEPLTIKDLAWALGYPESTIRDYIDLDTLYEFELFPPRREHPGRQEPSASRPDSRRR